MSRAKAKASREVAALMAMTLAQLRSEWVGKRHEVVVIESGVVYEGVTFQSLSSLERQFRAEADLAQNTQKQRNLRPHGQTPHDPR